LNASNSLSERVFKSILLESSDIEESFNAITAARDDADRCFYVASIQGKSKSITS
jgi:hypothetical protein